MKQMYFRTNYHACYCVECMNQFILMRKGYFYDVIWETDTYYLVCTDKGDLFSQLFNIVKILKEDLEDDVYVVTGKSEKLEEGGGAI